MALGLLTTKAFIQCLQKRIGFSLSVNIKLDVVGRAVIRPNRPYLTANCWIAFWISSSGFLLMPIRPILIASSTIR